MLLRVIRDISTSTVGGVNQAFVVKLLQRNHNRGRTTRGRELFWPRNTTTGQIHFAADAAALHLYSCCSSKLWADRPPPAAGDTLTTDNSSYNLTANNLNYPFNRPYWSETAVTSQTRVRLKHRYRHDKTSADLRLEFTVLMRIW